MWWQRKCLKTTSITLIHIEEWHVCIRNITTIYEHRNKKKKSRHFFLLLQKEMVEKNIKDKILGDDKMEMKNVQNVIGKKISESDDEKKI